MPIVFLKPTAQADPDSNIISGVLTDVDEGISSADGVTEQGKINKWNSGTVRYIEYAMEDLPGNATSINSIIIRVRARVSGGWINDLVTWVWNIVGSNINAAGVGWVGEFDDGNGLVTKATTDRNQGASVADVNAAVVRVDQGLYSQSAGPDGLFHAWDCFEIEVNYEAATLLTASGNPIIEEITASGNITQKQFATGTASIAEVIASGVSDNSNIAFGQLVKSGVVANTSQTTFSPNLGSNPASGNLLIVTAGAGESGALIDTAPSGFTLLHENIDGSGIWSWWYKISVGNEQTISVVWDGTVNGVTRYVEYKWDGSTPTLVKNENKDNEINTTNSQPSGAATPTNAVNIVLALHATDGNQNSFQAQAVDGSWIEDFVFFNNNTNQGEGKLSRLVNAPLSSQEATHTDTDAGDQMWGAIAVFNIGSGTKTATGDASIAEITASGVSTIIKKATGAVTIAAVVASGVAILVGDTLTSDGTPNTEEVVASGQSTQIYKPSGNPSLAEVTASGISTIIKKSDGTPNIEEIGASGQSIQTYKPSGTPSIDEIIASGVSNIIKKSDGAVTLEEIEAIGISTQTLKPSGTPSIAEITASGISILPGDELPSTGNPSIDEILASGVSSQTLKPSGNTVIDEITVSGQSVQTYKPSGTPSIDEILASGVAKIIKKSNGALSLDEITAAGQSTQTLKPSGTPSLLEAEAVGVSSIIKKSTGSLSIVEITASGQSTQKQFAGGALSVDEIEASGIVSIIKKSDGSLTLEEITAAGISTQTLKPSGTPSIDEVTASGISGFLRDSVGGITLPEVTASGVSTTQGEVTSVGTPIIEEIIATGSIIQRQFLSGTPSIDTILAAGIATIIKTSSGIPILEEILAAGVVTQTLKPSGAISLLEIEASGISTIPSKANGTPSIEEVIASGVSILAPKVYLNTTQTLSGATELPVTAYNLAGTSITFNDPIGAPIGALFLGVENRNNGGVGWIAVTVNAVGALTSNGTPSIEVITANGSVTIVKRSTGTLLIDEIIASGVVDQIQKPSGTPSIEVVSASGVSRIINKSSGAVTLPEVEASGIAGLAEPLLASGNPSIEEIIAAGTVIQTQKVTGAVLIAEITATGISTAQGELQPASGTPSIAEIKASGISTNAIEPVITPTTSYSGKIDLDLARPGDIEDPATDRAIVFLHDAVEQLSLSVLDEIEAITKGYGGIEQTGTPGISNLGAGFQVVPANAGLITTPIKVIQDFANDGIIVEKSGVWSVSILISLSHNEDISSRSFEVQLYNDTDAVELSSIPVPIARNQPGTFVDFTFIVEIPESAENNLLQIRIGNGSTVTSVVLEAYRFSVNHISEFKG